LEWSQNTTAKNVWTSSNHICSTMHNNGFTFAFTL
jgi:hypothetical protein